MRCLLWDLLERKYNKQIHLLSSFSKDFKRRESPNAPALPREVCSRARRRHFDFHADPCRETAPGARLGDAWRTFAAESSPHARAAVRREGFIWQTDPSCDSPYGNFSWNQGNALLLRTRTPFNSLRDSAHLPELPQHACAHYCNQAFVLMLSLDVRFSKFLHWSEDG